MATQAKRDYYEILSVSRTATEQEIKSSYRKLAMQWHPDRNPGNAEAEEKFKECTEAYSVLMDADKRARYDQYGHAAVNGGGFGGFDGSNFADVSDIFGDIFSDFFGVNVGGGRGGRTRVQRGGDARADITLTFEEAAFGKKTQAKVRRYEACEQCKGTGSAGSKGPTTCPTCAGRGQVRYQQAMFSIARTCPTCHGQGRVISDPCSKCKGESRVMKEHMIDVSVPAGVEDGTRIRYQEQGDVGPNGGPPGDLYVVLEVKPHPFFEREGKRPALFHTNFIQPGGHGSGNCHPNSGWRRAQAEDPGRNAIGDDVPRSRQRRSGAAKLGQRRYVREGPGGNAAQAHQTPARVDGRTGRNFQYGQQAGTAQPV